MIPPHTHVEYAPPPHTQTYPKPFGNQSFWRQSLGYPRGFTNGIRRTQINYNMGTMHPGWIFFFFFFSSRFYFPASGQAVVTGVPSAPRFLPSIFIAHRVQQSLCSSIFHRVLLTHALALSASQFVHKKKSQRIYTSLHSAGLELTKLTYTRLEDSLIRHRGDRCEHVED